jgi:hypothetical protein
MSSAPAMRDVESTAAAAIAITTRSRCVLMQSSYWQASPFGGFAHPDDCERQTYTNTLGKD